MVQGQGGAIAMGWAIRIWPKVFIEAEQHAVWLREVGALIDITPHPREETETYFATDMSLEISKAGYATRINQYQIVGIGKIGQLAMNMTRAAQKRQQLLLNKNVANLSESEAIETQRLIEIMLKDDASIKRLVK